eukprot:s887_g7.t1
MLRLAPEGAEGRHVYLMHTESRVAVAELKLCLDGFLIGQQALRVISGLASSGRQKEEFSGSELQATRFLRGSVLGAPPTKIPTTNLKTWLIFSDRACEGEQVKVGTIGAVLISPSGVLCSYFSELVPGEWMEYFLRDSNHHIFELELLPV